MNNPRLTEINNNTMNSDTCLEEVTQTETIAISKYNLHSENHLTKKTNSIKQSGYLTGFNNHK